MARASRARGSFLTSAKTMPPLTSITIRILQAGDSALLGETMALFSTAFDDPEQYTNDSPSATYHDALLANPAFIAIAALADKVVVGALTAYELPKPERVSKEVFLYDLGVSPAYRRQGVATALIRALQALAASRGASVVFVQAHREDSDAIALYSKHGSVAEVLHFDIPSNQ